MLDTPSSDPDTAPDHTLANVPLDALVGHEGRVRTHSVYHENLTHQELKGMSGMEVSERMPCVRNMLLRCAVTWLHLDATHNTCVHDCVMCTESGLSHDTQ